MSLVRSSKTIIPAFLAIVATLSGVSAAGAQPAEDIVALDRVCLVQLAGNVDATEEAANSFPNDVVASGGAMDVGTIVAYYGLQGKFRGLSFDVGVAGVGGEQSWHYYNGLGWEPLPLRNGEEPLQFDQTGVASMKFNKPDDWAPRVVAADPCGAGEELYYIKSSTDVPYDVIPLLNQASAIKKNA